MTADIDLRAVALGQRLYRLLQALDPESTAEPLLAIPISTRDGFSWDGQLSEAAAEKLTRLMEAAGEPTPKPTVRHLRLVAS